MQTRNVKRGLAVTTICLSLAGVLGWTALSQSDMGSERDVIAERQELMKNTGGNFKDLKLKAKEGQFARISVNAQTISINARHIPMLFPKGSMGTPEKKSRAKVEIWQNWDEFTAAAKKLQDSAMALTKLTQDADKMAVTQAQVDEAMKGLGESCKGCHKEFRVPKKKK